MCLYINDVRVLGGSVLVKATAVQKNIFCFFTTLVIFVFFGMQVPSPFLFRDLQSLFGLPAESQQSVVPGFVHFANEILPDLRQTLTSLSFPELLQRTAQQVRQTMGTL